MARPFSDAPESRAAVIAFARKHGTRAAAERAGVTDRTIRNWVREAVPRVEAEIDAVLDAHAKPEPEPPAVTSPPPVPSFTGRGPGNMPVVHVGAPMRPLQQLPRVVQLDELIARLTYAQADLLSRAEHDKGAKDLFDSVTEALARYAELMVIAKKLDIDYASAPPTRSPGIDDRETFDATASDIE